MSSDDIVFGDVSFREPKRLPRPDLDRRFASIAYELPRPDDLPIFLDVETADAIERHALRDTSVELGGILLGHECVDEETGQAFVWITRSLEAQHYENTQASFTYTHDAWEEITRERDRRYPDLDIVGWYHTHPDFGIFLSSHDQFLHRNFFGQPLQVAYVIDPIRQTRGFFRWRDDGLEQVSGYHLTADRANRLALARFINDLENIPNVGGGPGGLSPRLEAELIAMLSRPAYAPAPSDRGQLAAIFTVLGAALGVLAVAAVFWLNTLWNQIQEQGESLKSLRVALVKSDEAKQTSLDAARVQAKEAALDLLLREVQAGAKPGRFAELYENAQRELDEARAELKKQTVSASAVFDQNQTLQGKLAETNKKVAVLEKEADKARELTKQLDSLKADVADRDERLGDSTIHRRYAYAWYAAVTGWILCLVLGLTLSNLYLRSHPEESARPEAPHTIT
ncbi:MAG TPA: Mov34/MPN/PAD-1 family protein [Isosphaeraceae bacterium]|nr:Mov34/MPN/PAD-1 family protein [Isosphaeraceae bacterium]